MFKKLVVCGLIASMLSMPGIALAKSSPSKPPIRNSRPAQHQVIKHSAPKIHHKAPVVHHHSKPIYHHNNHRPVYYHHHSSYRPHHHSHGHSLHSGDYAVIAAGVILGAILASS